MQEHYFETIIIPTDCLEVFADFLIETTQEAIEERDIPSDICQILDEPVYFNTCHFEFLQKAFVVYSLKDPDEFLLPPLRDFCLQLSDRLGKDIGIVYQNKIHQQQDWIQNYKNSIRPIECGKFYVRPSWHKPKKESLDIIIDPALAFGSGHHASTSMCLEMLSNMSLKGKNILDVGCGSGILSIGAKRLGAKVYLCDTDLLAVDESKKNFALNSLEIDRIWQGSIDKSNDTYDVVIANIIADVIKMLYTDFCKVLKPNSILILSGILNEYKQPVLDTFRDFKVLEILDKDEWAGIKLTQK